LFVKLTHEVLKIISSVWRHLSSERITPPENIKPRDFTSGCILFVMIPTVRQLSNTTVDIIEWSVLESKGGREGGGKGSDKSSQRREAGGGVQLCNEKYHQDDHKKDK
jgi:hypothetical protein